MDVEGFKVPLHLSLTQPILLAGLPRRFAILFGTVTAALVLGLNFWWFIPLSALLYVVCAAATRRDSHLIEATIRHLRFAKRYDAR